MEESSVDLFAVLAALRRNVRSIVMSVGLGLALATLAMMLLPKRYKAVSVISIQSNYFRNPLVSDLIPESNEPSELQARRQSLLRMALSDEFIEALGRRYNLFKSPPQSIQRLVEREEFAKQIQYFALSASNYQISVSAGKAATAHALADAVLKQVVMTIMVQREHVLQQARSAIRTQSQILANTLEGLGKIKEWRDLRTELARMDARVGALRAKYTQQHPELVQLQNEAEVLRSQLRFAPSAQLPDDGNELSKAFLVPSSEKPIEEIHHDFLRKLSHLNVVLEMEQDKHTPSYLAILARPHHPTAAFFPNARDVYAAGLIGGLLLALITVLAAEAERRTRVHVLEIDMDLGIPQLGIMPLLGGSSRPLLEWNGNFAALPAGTQESA